MVLASDSRAQGLTTRDRFWMISQSVILHMLFPLLILFVLSLYLLFHFNYTDHRFLTHSCLFLRMHHMKLPGRGSSSHLLDPPILLLIRNSFFSSTSAHISSYLPPHSPPLSPPLLVPHPAPSHSTPLPHTSPVLNEPETASFTCILTHLIGLFIDSMLHSSPQVIPCA